MTRVLMLLAMSLTDEEVQAQAGTTPYPEYLLLRDRTDATLLTLDDALESDHRLVRLARRVSIRTGLAALAFTKRRGHDVFYCSGEDVALPFALMMRSVRDLGRTVTVVHNATSRKRRVQFRLAGSRVWRHLICVSEGTHRIMCEDFRLPSDTALSVPHWTDTDFFDPDRADPCGGDYAFSCGMEARDYDLLERAAADLDLTIRIKASGFSAHAGFTPVAGVGASSRDTANIEVLTEDLTYAELRNQYAGARFVIVPLKDIDHAAGATSICEAMAMGKAVLSTRSSGVRGYLRENETAVTVPCGDAEALRAAITTLATDPDLAGALGRRGRAWVTAEMSTDAYTRWAAELLGHAVVE